MKPIRIPTLSPEQLDALEKLYRTTREARLRTRAQMVLLAAERRMTAVEIAEIVRASEETVRRWLKRYPWPRESKACAMSRIRERHARSLRSTVKSWWRQSGAVRAAWGCHSRCGR